MPYYAKKKYRKKNKKPYRSYKTQNFSLMRKSPMPNVFSTKMRYAHNFNLDAGIAGIATQVFSCNGLYDPDISGTGHQPRGFDEIVVMYDHWRVLGAKITLRVQNGSSDQGSIFGISIQQNNTPLTLLNDYLESGTVVSKMVGTNDGMGVNGASYKLAPYKWLGLKSTEDTYAGTTSSNPNEQAFFHIFTGCVDDTVNPAALQCYVVIDYIVQFFEPKFLTQS